MDQPYDWETEQDFITADPDDKVVLTIEDLDYHRFDDDGGAAEYES